MILSKGPVLNGSLPELTCTQKHPRLSRWKRRSARTSFRLSSRQEGMIGGPNGAAARLGLPRTTLISKMRRLGINRGQSSALSSRRRRLVR